MEQKKTYVIRQIAYEFNDYVFDYVAEGGIEAYYHDYDTAYNAFLLLEAASFRRREAVLDKFPGVFNRNGSLNEEFDRKNCDGLIIPRAAVNGEKWDVDRFLCGQFHTISVFDTTPYFYIIETNLSHYTKEEVVTIEMGLDGREIPVFFPSYEEATHHLGTVLPDFVLRGTPEALSDMPALLQHLLDSQPFFNREDLPENTVEINIYPNNPVSNDVLKQLFELLREKPVTIKKVNIDHPALWNKK